MKRLHQRNEQWRPATTIGMLRKRAELLRKIRDFFSNKNVLEVETPILAKYTIPDPQIESIPVRLFGEEYFLQTSPEFHMKRLLASGSGSIFQITKAFRQGEIGHKHNPEFTMLEWYSTGFNDVMLMGEIAELFHYLYQIEGFEKISYQDAFLKYCDLDPFDTTVANCKETFQKFDCNANDHNWDVQTYCDYFMGTMIEPKLGCSGPQFVYDYPAEQAGLAKIDNLSGRAKRFELYLRGAELANGFYELTDAHAQQARFVKNNEKRKENHQREHQIDEHFIEALKHGLPECAGVAIGIDRLLMAMTDAKHIKEVIGFDIERA